MNRLNDEQIDELVDEAGHALCVVILNGLGIETGDATGMYFSGPNPVEAGLRDLIAFLIKNPNLTIAGDTNNEDSEVYDDDDDEDDPTMAAKRMARKISMKVAAGVAKLKSAIYGTHINPDTGDELDDGIIPEGTQIRNVKRANETSWSLEASTDGGVTWYTWLTEEIVLVDRVNSAKARRTRKTASMPAFETTIEVDAEAVEKLRTQGFAIESVNADGSADIEVEIAYEIDGADPSVGIMSAGANPISATATDPTGKQVDISDLIDLDSYSEQCLQHASDEDEAAYERHCDDEYEARRERDW